MSTTSPTKLSVHEAIFEIMGELGPIAKGQRNEKQGYNFRGIDDVVNAIAPLFFKHRIMCHPLEIRDVQRERYSTVSGTAMSNVTITVVWRFTGPDGSTMDAESVGEAADSGDKAVAKAQSVAYRVLLEKTFAIPTASSHNDPDLSSHERAADIPAQTNNPSGRDWLQEAQKLNNPDALFVLMHECQAAGELSRELQKRLELLGRQLRKKQDESNTRSQQRDAAVTKASSAMANVEKPRPTRQPRRTAAK